MKVTIENGMMTIVLPLEKQFQPSASGRSLTIATTRGCVPTECLVNNCIVYVGVNAFIKRTPRRDLLAKDEQQTS